jgi:hypothetical protein
MKKVLLIGLLSISLIVMAGVPLVDLIAKGGAQLFEIGLKKGLKQVENESLQLAFGALTKKAGIYTAKDIHAALDSIKPSGEYLDDVARISRIRKTLNKASDEVSESDMKKLVDDAAIIGHRYGDERGTTCGGDCGGGSGKLFTEASPLLKKFTSTKRMSANPADIRKSIQEMATKLKVGNLANATTEEALAKEDEEFVHVLLDMALNGDKDQKSFAKSLLDLSKHGNGPTNIFDIEFPNRLHRVLSDKSLDKKMLQYTDFFKRVDAHVTEPMSAREKLVKYMEDIVSKMDDSNPEKAKLKDAFDDFNSANCFK